MQPRVLLSASQCASSSATYASTSILITYPPVQQASRAKIQIYTNHTIDISRTIRQMSLDKDYLSFGTCSETTPPIICTQFHLCTLTIPISTSLRPRYGRSAV
ncbi:hypothetical protein B5807_09819 [Epicoccum nigrum]|uniref:Uncharacterized protein n=1 Tax=Epicoccum nigrum TaxID=105696 RepID=A0A1Y2LT47_EPING|nr:hypothetical protein B5807_09819 [Epicoccum nigrum]